MNNKVIGIISIKGGVGKTSVVNALSAALANCFNKKVLAVDANFNSPHLAYQIGIHNPEVTLHHVLDDKSNIKDAIYDSGYGFDIIPGALIYQKIDPFKLADKLRDVRRKYDFIILDSSPNLNEELLATMVASDELLVVTTPDKVTLTSTLRAIKLAKDKRTPINGIIMNKVYGKDFDMDINDIENNSGVNVLAVLPHELQVLEALSKSIPSTLHQQSPSTLEYRKLAGALVGEQHSEKGLKAFFQKLMYPVKKQDINRTIFAAERLNSL